MLLIKRTFSNFQRINLIPKTKQPGDSIDVRGWIKSIRKLKNNIFLDINDGSTAQKFQIVLPKTEAIKSITAGSLVKASGKVQLAPHGHYELHAQEVDVIADGHLTDGFPFSPKQQHAPEYVRDYLHLRSRIDVVAATMRLRHKAQKALHDFMDQHDFVQINTPVLTTNDCEGAGEVFTVQPDSQELLKQMSRPEVPLDHSYFDSKVYLTVSGQLHLESMSYGLGNTYCLGPAFRAENCKSPLHLSEFYMFEAELVYLDHIQQLCSFIEQMLKETTKQLLDNNAQDVEFCQKKNLGEAVTFDWLNKPWPVLSYKEALAIIVENKKKFKTAVTPNEGFSKEQELYLVEHCKSPVFVVDWPAEQKPFYMKQSREDPSLVHALDLLMPTVGELCGGSLRESDEKILRNHPQLPQGLDWYLELRKFGGLPTGGFGMGFERYLQLLTGVKNIRDVISFPRYPHSCKM
ncbi:probable asparagine--tRNA ligase, mitochondrial [Lucilia cuprina]|uniref:probable asparagine--tRNA ligase, mitochondrial n=1 Tax=Lucilia cuprina TaxID=7375 RepID=UPI001F053047|nr:probable asparagine--tRNA ligase, mitochondrial [Lucilia cuprina]